MMGTIKIITRENKRDNVTEFLFTYLDKTDVSELIRFIQAGIDAYNDWKTEQEIENEKEVKEMLNKLRNAKVVD